MSTTSAASRPTAPRIGILETGRPPDDLSDAHGGYDSMIARWLAGFGASFETYAVMDGVFPKAPDAADLWVVTGSKCGAYEDHPWIAPLEEFIRACQRARSKMIGICFGHQIIAQALGGRVEKSAKGWGLGVHSYAGDLKGPLPGPLMLQAFHQDQVTEPPEGAVVLAGSEFCPAGALLYPGFAVTIQGHPEFDHAFATALLDNRRGAVLNDAEADLALASMTARTNRDALADWLLGWYQGAVTRSG